MYGTHRFCSRPALESQLILGGPAQRKSEFGQTSFHFEAKTMRPITKANIAKHAKCSAATVSRAVKAELRGALIGDRVDLDDPRVQAFIAKHRARKARR